MDRRVSFFIVLKVIYGAVSFFPFVRAKEARQGGKVRRRLFLSIRVRAPEEELKTGRGYTAKRSSKALTSWKNCFGNPL